MLEFTAIDPISERRKQKLSAASRKRINVAMRVSVIASLLCALAIRALAAESKSSPPLRTRGEVEAILSKSRPVAERGMRQLKNIVLVATVKDHGPGEHDYPAWQKAWLKLLAEAQGVSVTNDWKCPTAEEFEKADVLVFYYWNHNWTPESYKQ